MKPYHTFLLLLVAGFATCNGRETLVPEPELIVEPEPLSITFDQDAFVAPTDTTITVSGVVTSATLLTSVSYFRVCDTAAEALGESSFSGTRYAFSQSLTTTAAITGFRVLARNRGGEELAATASISIVGSSSPEPEPTPETDSGYNAGAFPSAEGFGKYATGGRGGKVLYVTSLEDNSSEGTLRWAVGRAGARMVMFKVSGVIALGSTLEIKQPNLTIAGQTAPGDGICIKNYPVVVKADNVVIRYLRFRMGDEKNTADDALWGRNQKNIIIDHCSMSWSTDECASFYDNENFTMQWCIISESLRHSVHNKGDHGYGGIWGGKRASFHHNLLAHHDSRNPRFCGARYSNQADKELVDFRNNVIYSWGANSAYAGEGGCYNLVGNYYKPGSGTSNAARIFQPNADDGKNAQAAGVWGKFYMAGNYMLNKSGAPNTSVNSDNWVGVTPNPSSKSKAELKSDVEFDKGEVATHSAEEAYELVLQQAGASFRRDATDTRVVNEVRNGLTPVRASGNSGTRAGLIDSQADVGGWDAYASTAAPLDTDGDGIPDEWEASHGLNKNDPADGAKYSLSPCYTNVEVYVNGLGS